MIHELYYIKEMVIAAAVPCDVKSVYLSKYYYGNTAVK